MAEVSLVRVSLLGPIEVTRSDGRVLSLGVDRRSAVFALLALRANTPVSSEVLLSAVWDPPVPDRALAMLQTYLSRLRRDLLPGGIRWARGGVLSSSRGAYQLALAPGVLDLDQFEEQAGAANRARLAGDDVAAFDQLEAALRLWRGEPLMAVPGPALDRERRRLNERWLAVKLDQLEVAIRLGRSRLVIGELFALHSQYPWEERMADLLMVALCHCGRQADALQVYSSVRRRLDEELGIAPSAALEATYLRILRAETPSVGNQVSV
jgi:DNA-binding SARP family transcriptional activator